MWYRQHETASPIYESEKSVLTHPFKLKGNGGFMVFLTKENGTMRGWNRKRIVKHQRRAPGETNHTGQHPVKWCAMRLEHACDIVVTSL